MSLNLSTFPTSFSNGVSENNNPLFLIGFNIFVLQTWTHKYDIVAEWSRLWIADPLLFECVCSNSTDIDNLLLILVFVECNSFVDFYFVNQSPWCHSSFFDLISNLHASKARMFHLQDLYEKEETKMTTVWNALVCCGSCHAPFGKRHAFARFSDMRHGSNNAII
jgi:hypothetical protein